MIETKSKKFNSKSFHVFDSETMPFKKHGHFSHFALTDALIHYSGKHNQPVLHFWQTSPLVILGMMDTKIGQFKEAVQIFDHYKHDYIIRNSGGLAVVSDPGVLNVSLIYPSAKDNRLSIDQAYDFMLNFIRQTLYQQFPEYEIEAHEIKHSYCFGDYDLSINGQKIAGISQRRIQDGVAIMLYISVNGNQTKRAEMLKEFYEAGLDGSEPSGRYPFIKPEVMTTLEKAFMRPLSIETVKRMMLSHFDWSKGKYHTDIKLSFHEALEKMYKRNKRFLGEDFIQDNVEGDIKECFQTNMKTPTV